MQFLAGKAFRGAFRRLVVAIAIVLAAPAALADVSGNWTFAVTLGELGSGNATITLVQEADSKLSGTYAGQLNNGPVSGTYSGNDFEFAFNSALLGGDITYKGMMKDDGTLEGSVIAGGQNIGTFKGTKAAQ